MSQHLLREWNRIRLNMNRDFHQAILQFAGSTTYSADVRTLTVASPLIELHGRPIRGPVSLSVFHFDHPSFGPEGDSEPPSRDSVAVDINPGAWAMVGAQPQLSDYNLKRICQRQIAAR